MDRLDSWTPLLVRVNMDANRWLCVFVAVVVFSIQKELAEINLDPPCNCRYDHFTHI